MREVKRAASERGTLGRGAQGETSRRKKVRLPAWAADRRPDRFTLLLAAAAASAAGLVLLRVAGYGPLVWYDAVGYITAARSLLAGDGLVGLGGVPVAMWPPLYPVLLAAGGGLFGIDPYAVAGPLNAVIFGLTVLVTGWWLRRHLQSRFLWLWGCFSIALALPLAHVASQALTESAFILFVTLALTQIDAHLDGGGRASLMRAAAFSAAACLTRYMGASVILAVVLLLLAARVAPREKVKRIAVYTLLVAAPVGLWMLRNFLLVGSMTGERGRGFYSLPFIADEALRIAAGEWWLVGLTAPVLLALALAAGHALHRRSQRKSGAPVAAQVARGPLRVCGGFALAYLTLLVAALMSGGAWDGLSERFLAPLYVPLLCAALLLLDGALRYARKRSAPAGSSSVPVKTLAAVLMLALSLQAAWLVVLHKREIPFWNAGEGYGAPRWRNSESVQYIREAALTGVILSNVHLALILHADDPARRYELLCGPDYLRWALSNAPGGGETHVLYFSDWGYWRPCPRQQDDDLRSALSRDPWLELVAEPADGKLYRLIEPEFRPAATFHTPAAPVVGREVSVVFNESRGRRLPGESWRWEKGGDAAGWTSLPVQRPDDVYVPTVADVGQRLRASMYYADRLGNRVKAMTKPSEPVQPDFLKAVSAPPGSEDGKGAAGASEAYRIITSKYAAYLYGNRLFYANRSCIWEDEYGTRFPLIVYSLDAESGKSERDMLDFGWRKNFWQDNGICVIERRLPNNDIVGIRTGQVDRDGNLLWENEHWFEEKRRWFDNYWSSGTSGEPAVRADFDVYLSDNTLTYAKEPCSSADTEAKFFLALYPADANDLPDRRRRYGFDNLDFDFDGRGMVLDGRCMVRIPLPEYAIARIGTGQYVSVEGGFHNLWEVEMRLDDGVALIVNAKESLEAALRSDYETLVSGEPVIRSDFDVYLSENTLTYVKEPCVRADTEATFFLALFPADVNDLPDHRKQYGFDNLDFDFDGRGMVLDGRCMARIPLPEYDITRIGTGQYVARRVLGGFKHFWEGEFRLER